MPAETEEQESPLDVWFEENPEPPTEEKEKEIVEEKEEIVEEEEQEEQEEEEDDDYEKPLPKEKRVEEEDKEPENESEARKRAKIEGRKRKELEATLTEKQVEMDRLTSELEEKKARLEELENTRIKPHEHPDFVSMRDKIVADVRDDVDDLDAPNKRVVFNKIEAFIKDYQTADASDDREKQLDVFKDKLAEQLFGEETTFDSLDKDDRRVVSSAVRIVKNNAKKYDELRGLLDTLDKRSKSGTLSVGVRDYERTVSEFKPLLDAVGDLPEDVIEANPHTLPAYVATLAKTEAGKKRLELCKRDALDIIFGSRPYTQEELTKLEANGTDLKTHFAEREKLVNKKRQKLLPLITQTLMIAGNLPEIFEELATLKGNKEAIDSEETALRKIGKKKTIPKEEKKEKSPVDIMFED